MRGMGSIVVGSEAYRLRAQALLPNSPVLRRMLALAGFVAVVTLALLLLYRVYVHHTNTEPYVDDGHSVVSSEVNFARAFS